VHNITEVLIYSGIAWLIVPNIPLGYVALLLVAIALYDAWAVWQSKHMVAMAQFQTESKLFAGLLVPYTASGVTTRTVTASAKPSKNVKPAKASMRPDVALGVKPVARAQEGRNAILGGGDIAFPLFFSGATFIALLERGFATAQAFGLTLIVVAGSTAALTGLLVSARKDAFYPAMPFIGAGCFVGYAVLWLVAL
jgi:presenilin-like A22 family membrane protease